MAGVEESPLKKYEHLLPTATHSINELDQYLFLVNVGTLFTAEDAAQLRLIVARTEDHVPGTSETRTLFYAMIASLSNSFSIARPGEGNGGNILVRGPAVPYFAPHPSSEATAGNGAKSWSKSNAPDSDPDKEMREAKELAIGLLMKRLEEKAHDLLKPENLEIWEPKDWKYGEPRGAPRSTSNSRATSIRSGKAGWFAK